MSLYDEVKKHIVRNIQIADGWDENEETRWRDAGLAVYDEKVWFVVGTGCFHVADIRKENE